MTHFNKLKTLKWVSSNFVGIYKYPLSPVRSLFVMASNPRFYWTQRIAQPENCDETLVHNAKGIKQIPRATIKQAQAALLEYLHSTRSLQFMDAENMSKNSPCFLEKLLQKVDTEADIGQSIARFLRYHPINEFEPFFESLGLKPHEYSPLLPRDLMFLIDDDLLLENYHVLCNYGMPRTKIGTIYKLATEAFSYDHGVLALKLGAYEELGLSRSFMTKVIVCCPSLLIGDMNMSFIKLLEILRKGGIEVSWIEEHLSEKSFYDWRRLLTVLNLFGKTGYTEQQLGALIIQHPKILFEGSGFRTLSLIGVLFKFGSTMDQIYSMFLQFPQMQVETFVSNFRQCFLFLNEVKMNVHEMGNIFRSHPLLLGTCTLKKTSSLTTELNAGKKRLCKIIQENPEEMKKWVMGSKVERLPNSGEELRSRMLKTKFLLDLGFVENSKEMEKATKALRGRGGDLQERFNCILKAGLDLKDVCQMIKSCPQILNQSKDVIQMKIDFLVNELGYPVSTLVTFPAYLAYTTQRVKLRLAMFNWLKEQGTANPMSGLSTVVGYTEKKFMQRYVKHHPKGPDTWRDLQKKEIVLNKSYL